jgi:DNA-binding NtrC family response regulator
MFLKSTANTAISLPHVHVMVMDDSAASRVRIHHALRVMGVMHVSEVTSSGEVKNVPSLRTVDLIISDLELGTGSGLSLLKAIRLGRVAGIRADVPFIFVSDVAYPRMISAAAHLDANGFVIRPLSTDRLRTVMLRALKHRVELSPEKYVNIDVVEALRLSDVSTPEDRAARHAAAEQARDRAKF